MPYVRQLTAFPYSPEEGDVMEQIAAPKELSGKICGRQKEKVIPYRFSRTCLRIPCEDGELWYNCLTGELIYLLPSETDHVFDSETGNSIRCELISRWFLVPEDHDEYAHGQQVRKLVQLYGMRDSAVTDFTVFPTTDCNARCFYCYELGRPRVNMSVQIAEDVAGYIKKVSLGQDVKIRWFGGEPLFNMSAIDTVCHGLRTGDVGFVSQMTTNGYLFDKATVDRAKNDWNLSAVQITLDGTEEVYNRTKAYIYIGVNAYEKVMQNIGLLLDAEIAVHIRLNMNRKNDEDLYRLSDELAERFRGRRGFGVYVHQLMDFGREVYAHNDELEGLDAVMKLKDYLYELGIGGYTGLSRKVKYNQCMADNDKSVTILPDGRIGKCEHESEEKLVGSIYGTEIDRDMIKGWKETLDIPECRECALSPSCIKLKCCSWNTRGCTETDRLKMKKTLEYQALREYRRFRDGSSGAAPDPGSDDMWAGGQTL